MQRLPADSDNTERCNNAGADTLQVCSEYYNTCN